MEIKESKKAKKELRDLPFVSLNEKEMSAVQGGQGGNKHEKPIFEGGVELQLTPPVLNPVPLFG